MDLIAALRTFLRVAEVGSFSAVAEERGVTQPAVSRQVSALEEHFGTRLVQRSTHAVTLTEEGRDLVPAAQQLVDSADALQERTGRRRTKPMGRVRLSVPVPLGLYFSSKLNSLLKKHDELSIDLILHDRLRDLIEEGIDLQVCVGEVNESALISRRIGATTAFLVAAPDYLKGRAGPNEPADLQQHDCIVYHRWGRDDVWWFAGPEGTVSASVRGRLRVLMPAFPPARFPLSVVYPSRRNLPPRVRAVIEFLSEIVQADPAQRDDGAVPAVPHSEVSGPD